MKKKTGASKSLAGMYYITWMEQWDQDFVNEETQGYFRFGKESRGDFHFGFVQGEMDCSYVEREGMPAVEFSWEGHNECNPATGRGWAVLDSDELTGQMCFHFGDESAFKAKRK